MRILFWKIRITSSSAERIMKYKIYYLFGSSQFLMLSFHINYKNIVKNHDSPLQSYPQNQ